MSEQHSTWPETAHAILDHSEEGTQTLRDTLGFDVLPSEPTVPEDWASQPDDVDEPPTVVDDAPAPPTQPAGKRRYTATHRCQHCGHMFGANNIVKHEPLCADRSPEVREKMHRDRERQKKARPSRAITATPTKKRGRPPGKAKAVAVVEPVGSELVPIFSGADGVTLSTLATILAHLSNASAIPMDKMPAVVEWCETTKRLIESFDAAV